MASSLEDIEREIAEKIRRGAEVKRHGREFAEEVRDHWRDIAPVRTGAYKASIHIANERMVDGMPEFTIKASDHGLAIP